MFFKIQSILTEFLVNVFLKLGITKGITFLKRAVSIIFNLEALVSQMHKIIFICQIVLRTGSAHISLFIDINSKVFGNNGPDAQIKFSFLVQEWLFNVLLNDPKGFFLLFFENELNYVPKLFEYLDATSLVQCSRLNNPHILLAMLVRNSFVPTSSVVDFSEPMHKFIDFPII